MMENCSSDSYIWQSFLMKLLWAIVWRTCHCFICSLGFSSGPCISIQHNNIGYGIWGCRYCWIHQLDGLARMYLGDISRDSNDLWGLGGGCSVAFLGFLRLACVGVWSLGIIILVHEWSCLIRHKENINVIQSSKAHTTYTLPHNSIVGYTPHIWYSNILDSFT